MIRMCNSPLELNSFEGHNLKLLYDQNTKRIYRPSLRVLMWSSANMEGIRAKSRIYKQAAHQAVALAVRYM